MGVPCAEQETNITYSRTDDIAEIYTSDSTVMTRLDKLVESDAAPEWKLVDTINDQYGNLVAKRYKTNKRLISFRSAVVTHVMTEEERKAAGERLRAVRTRKETDQL